MFNLYIKYLSNLFFFGDTVIYENGIISLSNIFLILIKFNIYIKTKDVFIFGDI